MLFFVVVVIHYVRLVERVAQGMGKVVFHRNREKSFEAKARQKRLAKVWQVATMSITSDEKPFST